MEVKPDYKQTEVGVIPEEWMVKPLAAIADRIMVGIASAATHAYRAKGVPMFRNQNIKTGYLDDSDLLFIAPEYEVTFKNKRLRGGDLLTMRTGYPGVTAIVPPRYDSAQSFTTLITRPRQEEAESAYLCHFINSEIGQRFFTQSQIGGAQKNVNAGTLRHMPVPLPKLPEQRAIATALSDVDGLLGGLDRLIAKKRDLKQAAMQQLLTGQTRLPGFHGEWEVKRLGDAGKCLRGVSYQGDSDLSTYDTIQTKRLLRSNNVQNAVVVTDEVQFVNAARVSSHQMLKKRDILICMANGSKALVGKAGLFVVSDGYEYTFGAFMGCFRTNSAEANPIFVFYLFQTGRYRAYINNLLAGSSINNLRPSSIESLEFSTPPLPEQTAIAEVLTDMDAELAALEQRREKTRALKQAMMQELLTGRTRLV
jgi:type I restriction enzyme S subunit